MQDLTLSRQQFITDPQPRHRPQVTSHNRIRHNLRHLSIFAFTFFDRSQRLPAQFLRARLVFRKKAGCLRIQIPAVIIKLRLLGHHLHADWRPLFHVQKSDYHVRHLHARVINVVLNLHAVPDVTQDSHHRVAKHRIPHVPDVRCFVGIDARMFDDDFS